MKPLDPSSAPPPALASAALRCLERGGAVVAANARAARWLRRSHAEAQLAVGRGAWPTPAIHDWEGWLGALWRRHLQSAPDAPLLLTALQERAAWKKIAAAQAGNSEAAGLLASKAWELLSEHDAHGERNQAWTASGADAEVFRGWAASFDRECRGNRWVARGDLAALLAESIRQGNLSLPGELLLLGFDRVTPARSAWIEAARTAGCEVVVLEAPAAAAIPRLVQAADPRDELAICAWWARRTLEGDPAARVAIIVEGLDEKRGEIERALRQVLMPGSLGVEAREAMPFEFSKGSPLASVPAVKAALLLLRWLAAPLEQSEASWLAMSGYLAAPGEDLAEMAKLDAEMRQHGRMPPEVPLAVFAQYRPRSSSSDVDSETARQFLSRLRGVLRTAQSEGVADRRRTFPEWLDVAESLLRQARWPGPGPQESVEFQALSRWERLVGEMAGLGFDGSRVGWSEFADALRRCAEETIFAPESHNAPIQILGALESSGQEFDAIWFLGADERQWPPPSSPHPLLPLWLQCRYAMPHSSLDADWALHLHVTRRVGASAAQCVFSHALRDDAGELRPSALLAEAFGGPLPRLSAEELRASLRLPAERPHLRQTVASEDGSSVPWPKDLDAGGAEILKRQSACAFQSFAARRLGAKELEAAERGLTPRERGTLVHSVMESFWSKPNPAGLPMGTRDDLVNAKAGGCLPEILRHHIDTVFEQQFKGTPREGAWFRAYLRVEQDRLHAVLSQWLDYEAERAPFEVVAQEEEFPLQLLNGLKLRLRVDRIDRVEGGSLILDYKTGSVSASMWDGDRPEEPQLPLYGAYGPVEELRGVLFAQVRAGDMGFVGRARDATATVSGKLPASSALVRSPLTEDMVGQWSDHLSNLADQFLAGDAAVAPKRYPKTCEFCPLAGLCRVAETLAPLDDEAAEDDAAGSAEVFADD